MNTAHSPDEVTVTRTSRIGFQEVNFDIFIQTFFESNFQCIQVLHFFPQICVISGIKPMTVALELIFRSLLKKCILGFLLINTCSFDNNV